MYNFLEQLKEQFLRYDNKLANKALEAVGEVGNKIISVASIGTIDPKKLAEVISKGGEVIKGEPLGDYKETIDNLERFKGEIAEVVKHLDGKNIYIFVDELERCRPTFAVELLESIKHLFNIPGLVFILGIDRSQLKHTISNIYGLNMDSEGYIRRFIDLELSLPPANTNQFIKMLCQKFEIEHKESKYSNTWTAGYEYFNMFFDLFAKPYNLSLREMEQCYTEFNIITKTIQEGQFLVTPVLAFLIIIKNKNTELYAKFGTEINTGEQIYNYLEKYVKPQIPASMDRLWEHFSDLMVMTFEQNLDDKLNEAKKILEKEPENQKNIILGTKYQNAAEYKRNNSYHLWNLNILEYLKCKLMYISKDRF